MIVFNPQAAMARQSTGAIRHRAWACIRLGVLLLVAVVPAAVFAQDAATTILSPPPPTDDEWRKDIQIPYREALKSNQLDRGAKELIDRAIHYQVYLLVAPGKQGERNKNITKLIADLRNRSTSEAARLYAVEQVKIRCEQLLAEAARDSKVNGALLLTQLNSAWAPDVPYVPAADPLMATFALGDEFLDVKLIAADGLGRILQFAPARDLPALKRIDLANALVGEIQRLRDAKKNGPTPPDAVGYNWCMWSLVQALGHSDRVYNAAREPVYADTLMAVLTDPQEDWHTRSRAAEALSRLPYEATTNLDILNFETARLTHDMAVAYNDSLKGGPQWPLWRRAALHVYFAYETRNAADRKLNMGLNYQVNRSGLNGFAANTRAAYGLELPIVNVFVANTKKVPPIPDPAIAALSAWLAQNAPANRKLTAESKFEAPNRQAAATPAAAGGEPAAE